MSRIGNRELIIPEKVNVEINERVITVKGPKGELSLNIDKNLEVNINENKLTVKSLNDLKRTNEMQGTLNANINNMIKGVNEGYTKNLEIVGVGYRFNVKGRTLQIQDGKSHLDIMEVPVGLEVKAVSNTEIEISGIDKCKVGQFAAEVRANRPPEPYKGKGIRYKGEYVRRKVGKKAAK